MFPPNLPTYYPHMDMGLHKWSHLLTLCGKKMTTSRSSAHHPSITRRQWQNERAKQTNKARYCDYADILFLSPNLGDSLLMLLSLEALATCKRQEREGNPAGGKCNKNVNENDDNKESNPFVHTWGAIVGDGKSFNSWGNGYGAWWWRKEAQKREGKVSR